jgi:3-hydroxyisobutyrate dehydrogenase
VVGTPRQAAALKLLANGVLGDSLVTLRRAVARGRSLDLSQDGVVELLAHTALGGLVSAKRDRLGAGEPDRPADFAALALAKDLRLLAEAAGSRSDADALVRSLFATGSLGHSDDIARIITAEAGQTWYADARLAISPDLVPRPEVLRPLHLYALGHATGNDQYFRQAFRATGHVEGYRDGVFTSWDLDDYCRLFTGGPAPDEWARLRRLDALDVRGATATATMTLRHGVDRFVDRFLLVEAPEPQTWHIANKVYEREPRASRSDKRVDDL